MKADVYDGNRYQSWLKHANERDILEIYLRNSFDSWCSKNPFSMVELGCGLGSAAQRFFKVLNEREVDFKYLGIDPFPNQLAKFREDCPDENIELVEGSFETFIPAESYDLALVIHSLYYTQSMRESLEKVFQVADRAFIVHHGVHGINLVHQTFPDLVNRMNHRVSTYHDVASCLREMGVGFELQELETQVNIEPCKDSKNQHGRNMIEFFMERTDLSEEDFERVSEYFQKMSAYMRHEVGVIVT